MRRNSHKTTYGVKLDLKFDFSVPDFLYVEKFCASKTAKETLMQYDVRCNSIHKSIK